MKRINHPTLVIRITTGEERKKRTNGRVDLTYPRLGTTNNNSNNTVRLARKKPDKERSSSSSYLSETR